MAPVSLNVKATNEQKYSVTVDSDQTVADLKQNLESLCDTPAAQQRLIYSGRVLKDTDKITATGLQDGHTIHLVKVRPATAAPATATPTGTSTPSMPSTNTAPGTAATAPNPAQPAGGFAGMHPLFMPSGTMGAFGGGAQPGGAGAGAPDFGQMMQNPAFQQLTQQIMQEMSANPQLAQSMLTGQMSPEMMQFMMRPEVMRLMMDPAFLQNVMQMEQALGGARGGPGMMPGMASPPGQQTFGATATPTSTGGPAPPTGQPAAFNPMLASLLFPQGGPNQPQAQNQEPPEVRFQVQLQQLSDMGFYDADSNIRALLATGGNVSAAIERLLNQSSQGAGGGV